MQERRRHLQELPMTLDAANRDGFLHRTLFLSNDFAKNVWHDFFLPGGIEDTPPLEEETAGPRIAQMIFAIGSAPSTPTSF
jgi:hypothetical protein